MKKLRKVFVVFLAICMLVTATSSSVIAAGTDDVDTTNSARATVLQCPSCGSYNIKAVTARVYVYTYHTTCTHCAYGTDTYKRYQYISSCTCQNCGDYYEIRLNQYDNIFVSCEGWD